MPLYVSLLVVKWMCLNINNTGLELSWYQPNTNDTRDANCAIIIIALVPFCESLLNRAQPFCTLILVSYQECLRWPNQVYLLLVDGQSYLDFVLSNYENSYRLA